MRAMPQRKVKLLVYACTKLTLLVNLLWDCAYEFLVTDAAGPAQCPQERLKSVRLAARHLQPGNHRTAASPHFTMQANMLFSATSRAG